MAVRNITVFLTGDATSLTTTLRATAASLDRFVAETEAKGTAAGGALTGGLTRAAGVAGIALVGALAAAGVAASGFDERMRNVNSIAGESETQFAKTEQSVLNLSRSLPQSANTLAEGLYNIQSSGFKGAEALNVLAQSGQAASAGLSSTDVASRAITGALNAYGLSAASAKDVSDILFKTVDFGIVTFQEAAQNFGDFVGTANAAKVPLGDVAAAFATVTRSGIPAAEAATSINQLLTQLLRPSKNLAAAYQELGYTSGGAALQQKGLAGVVADLGRVTGGSAEQIVRLFGRVESGKALFGLLANDGKTYAEALKEVADKSGYAGATQRAFSEQMKSASAQVKIALNDLQASAIEIGLHLLPPFVAFLKLAHDVGGDAVPAIEAAFRAVYPVMQQVWSITGDIVSILVQLQQGAAPIEKALLGVAGAAVLGPLHAFLSLLQAVTGFLVQHQGVVQAVAAIIATRYVFAMAAAVAQTIAFNVRSAIALLQLAGMGTAGGVAAAGMTAAGAATRGVTAALLSFQTVATVGVGAAVFGLVRGFQQWNDAQDQAKSNADKARSTFDAYDTTKAQGQLEGLRKVAEHGIEVGKQYDGVIGTLKAGFSEVAGDGSVGKVAADGLAAAQAYNELNAKLQNTQTNLKDVAAASGLSVQALSIIAKQQNIDLSGPYNKSADARQQLLRYTQDLSKESNRMTVAIAQGAGQDVAAMQELEKQIQAVVDKVDKAFQSDTDVLGSFSPGKYADAVSKAEDQLAKARKGGSSASKSSLADEQALERARQRVADTEARVAVQSNKTASERLTHEQEVARARQALVDLEARQAEKRAKGTTTSSGKSQALADAEKALADAKQAQAAHGLEASYKSAITEAQQFTVDINQVVQRGLDPAYVSKLLQEGPKKALPVLQTLLADHSNRLIKVTNASEKTLAQLNEYAIEQARVTAQAINNSDTFYITHHRTAMAIIAAESASGGKKSARALAQALNVPESEIREVATKFGLQIASDVQDAVDRNPVQIKLQGAATAKRLDARDARGYADGGLVTGAPAYLGDVVPALLKGAEYVQPTHAVAHYGVEAMDALRSLSIPRQALRGFAGGGLAGRDGSWVSGMGRPPEVRVVPVPIRSSSSIDNSVTYQVGTVNANSPDQLSGWAGPRRYSGTKGVG
jgi:TP901 family phage tail tape measure protein